MVLQVSKFGQKMTSTVFDEFYPELDVIAALSRKKFNINYMK